MGLNDSDNEKTLTILVNTKYSRITVHKSTLNALGLPAFIQLGYNSNKKRLMLFGANNQSQNTIRVVLKHNSFCYIHRGLCLNIIVFAIYIVEVL